MMSWSVLSVRDSYGNSDSSGLHNGHTTLSRRVDADDSNGGDGGGDGGVDVGDWRVCDCSGGVSAGVR